MGYFCLGLGLRNRLKDVRDLFDICIIDSPPPKSQISLTAMVAADELVILVEASSKGMHSSLPTLQLICFLKEVNAFTGSVLGQIS